jgi:hypothetical protein
MATNRADQVKRLSDAALQWGSAERAAYLAGIADLDPELRREVESLLAPRLSPPSWRNRG